MSVSAGPDLDWHGEAVTIEDVLAALNHVRRQFAIEQAGEIDQPHPRNSVMTLVAIAANDAEETRAQRTSLAIATHHPSLAIVVRDEPRVRAGRIDALVSAPRAWNVHYELVSLRVQGAAGKHLAALVDPLLVSGVPTYMWWLGTPPFGSYELMDALRISDALVVDSAKFDRPYHSFLALSDLAQRSHRNLGLGDCQWTRLEPWREITAQFFSPQERRGFMRGITELGIDYAGEGRGNRIAAGLMVGWLASALGWKLQRAAAGSGGVVAALFHADDSRTVEVALRSVLKTHLLHGEVCALRIAGTSGGATFQLSIQRDPDRSRPPAPNEFQSLHSTGGEDDAGLEIAHRKAAQHREVVIQNREELHHTSTGDPPGESLPPYPTVHVRERRRVDTADVLLTMIDIGEAETLRHVQRVQPEDEAAILLKVLWAGARDAVYNRSLAAAAELMRAL